MAAIATTTTATTTTTTTTTNNVEQLFETLDTQKSLVTKCTDLYKALTSTFISLKNSIDSKTLTLESKFQSLDSLHQLSLTDLDYREESLPDVFNSLSANIEAKKTSAIEEVQRRRVNKTAHVMDVLKCLCRRMDHGGLVRVLIDKKKETTAALRDEIGVALRECVDPARVVLETVKEFVEAKATAKRITDKKWACGVIVSGLFPPDELKKKGKRVEFSRKMVAEAEAVVREWREKGGEGGGGGESKMGSAEAAMFLQVVVGFGLTAVIEEKFYEKVAMEFSARRDMAKLAIPIFGDKLPDFIEHLIKNGKEVEAVYFASEAGLTERFQPLSLLKSCLHNSKKNLELLKKDNHDAATDEANNFEMAYIRAIIKCVEDHKLETDFSVASLKKRLSSLEKARFEKKKGSTASSRPSNKRAHGSGGSSRSRNGRSPRPVKRTKYPSHGNHEAVSPVISPVSRYVGQFSLSGQAVYDPALPASTYGQRYGSSHVPSAADQITQQHYGVSGGSAPIPSAGPRLSSYSVCGGSVPSPSAGPRLGSPYGLQSAYGVYDYGATTTKSTYQPGVYDYRATTTTSTYQPGVYDYRATTTTTYQPGVYDYGAATTSTYQPGLYDYGATTTSTYQPGSYDYGSTTTSSYQPPPYQPPPYQPPSYAP